MNYKQKTKGNCQIKQRMCTGKTRFSEKLARKVSRQHGQRAYFCPACHWWHCTSSPGTR